MKNNQKSNNEKKDQINNSVNISKSLSFELQNNNANIPDK